MQHQLGETIRKYRKQKCYTMAQLANKLEISIGLLSNIETGKTDSLQLNLLNNLVKTLDIPLSELQLFSKPYPIKELNINIVEDYNKIKPSLETLLDAFISVSSALSFDEDKTSLVANMLVEELNNINKLIEISK
ncbi:helix-turn-helix transcriptional regulator [Clostridium sp. BSD9I1]|uniref:helix-turn-helix transcriptional regulator n=1 Tax=Clostridium sp. BSD9I1 TaxID=2003589 RepID=UPI0016456D82|nr:helix-turn-helix transcriptional regulator [Clostridium sp. BSD9I1]